jgi:pre-mRNA-splicing factor CWC22
MASRGGVYVPPHLRKAVRAEENTEEAQREAWEALRKGINAVVNKVNAGNIVAIIPELFRCNLVRGRGLLCRAVQKAQMASPGFTHVYAALIAVINTKLPEIGELLLKRLIVSFKRAYKRNNKVVAVAAAKFLGHLVNQQVAHEIIALQLLALLLERPTDDSVEVAVSFTKEVGALLGSVSPAGLNAAFERFRGILQDHDGSLDMRTQYLIEGLFVVRKAKFVDFPSVQPDLDLVESTDQITHDLALDAEEMDGQTEELADVFALDGEYAKNEVLWEDIAKEALGGEAGGDGDGGGRRDDGGEGDEGEGERDGDGAAVVDAEDARIQGEVGADGTGAPSAAVGYNVGGGRGHADEILDMTEGDLVNLRRTIYLTIMSSLSHEEAGHKLMKMSIPRGAEGELASMLIECCSQERSFLKYYALLAGRFCMIARPYQEAFDAAFAQQYAGIHRLETGRLRNVGKFFAHLLAADALPWTALEYLSLSEESTNPSSRIFLKVLFQELAEYMGLGPLRDRLCDPDMADVFAGLLPRDDLRSTRFAINFFTSIGLGGLTDGMREFLKAESARNAALVAAAAGAS